MADASLLACPHCGKPIAFAAELAGKLAACPHCQGPFTMPATPPPPPKPATPPAKRPNATLRFDTDVPLTHTTGPRYEREPDCFGSAEKGSLVFAVCGTIFAVVSGTSLFWLHAMELFPQPGVRAFVLAMLWTLAAIAVFIGGIAASWTVRHLVSTIVLHVRQSLADVPAKKS